MSEGRDSSERSLPSAGCCSRPENEPFVFAKAYSHDQTPGGSRPNYGLIRCTPQRPEGCCSFDHHTYNTHAAAQAAAHRWNEAHRAKHKVAVIMLNDYPWCAVSNPEKLSEAMHAALDEAHRREGDLHVRVYVHRHEVPVYGWRKP